jgi:hypothetical protein
MVQESFDKNPKQIKCLAANRNYLLNYLISLSLCNNATKIILKTKDQQFKDNSKNSG